MKYLYFLVLSFILLISCKYNTSSNEDELWIITSPSGNDIVKIDKSGKTIIPNGRIITPEGKSIVTAPHPYGLTLSPDGNIAVTANSGTSPLSITIIRNILSNNPDVQQVPPGPSTDKGVLASVFMGLAISPDNQTVYVAGGQENKIYLFDIQTGVKKDSIDCSFVSDKVDYSHGYIGDLKLSKDGKTLYAVDQIGFRMIIADTKTKKLKYSVPVGRYPFGICLSPDEKRAYVANVGMFQYAFIQKPKKDKSKTRTRVRVKPVDFPIYAYGSKEMVEGIENDTILVKGLGETNAIEAFSVFSVDLEDAKNPSVVSKIKTGHLVGAMVDGIPAVGGSSPNSMVATDKFVFVSNATNDNISVISIEKDTVVNTIYLKPDDRVKQFRGVIPFGLGFESGSKKIVCCRIRYQCSCSDRCCQSESDGAYSNRMVSFKNRSIP